MCSQIEEKSAEESFAGEKKKKKKKPNNWKAMVESAFSGGFMLKSVKWAIY